MLRTQTLSLPIGLPAMLGRESAPEIRFTQLPLTALDPARRAAMLELARRTCPDLDARSYFAARLGEYDYVVLGEAQGRLLAFQLVQEFVSCDERYVYLGPLFSREGACVPLFSALFDAVMDSSAGITFHLLTELQSPRVALLFKRMFLRSSYPRLSDGAIPERAREAVREFACQLPHIGAVDFANLSTRSNQTLFRTAGDYAPVVEWMQRRGVDLSRGQSQIFIVSCGASPVERAALRLEVWLGQRALLDPRSAKRRMLERFQQALR